MEPGDSQAFQALLGAIKQSKRSLSLKVGTQDTPLESMHLAKTMRDMLGETPSQARVSLVAAQGQLYREELLQAVSDLDNKAFKAVSALEVFAAKTEGNSEASLSAKGEEILEGVERYRARVRQAIGTLEGITAGVAPAQPSLAPTLGPQPRVEPENKFTPNSSKSPDDLPPRVECNPKQFSDW